MACGKSDGQGTPSPTATAVTSEPAATATIDPATATTVKPSRLSSLSSYRYTVAVIGHGGPMSRLSPLLNANRTPTANVDSQYAQIGQYVAPDRYVTAVNFGFLRSTTTAIGDQLWVYVNGNLQGPSKVDAEKAQNVNVAPSYWDTTGLVEDFGAFACSRDLQVINGVNTRICVMDKQHYLENRLRYSGLLNDVSIKEVTDFICEVALSLDGYPIRLRIGLAGIDVEDNDFRISFQMDLLDLNGKGIKIEPPR